MVRAQLHQLRKGRERSVIRDMLLNVFGQSPSLPACQTAAIGRCAEWIGIAIDANEIVRQQNSQGLPILPVHRVAIFNLDLELESSLPKVRVVEEQPRLELDFAEPQSWIGKRALRVDVEVDCTRQRTRLLRPAKVMPCGNEGQPMRKDTSVRRRQTLKQSFSVLSVPKL